MKKIFLITVILAVLSVFFMYCPDLAGQDLSVNPDEVSFKLSLDSGGFSKAVNILLLMTALSLAPSAIMMMTSFTRIVIVISFLKQAMSLQNAPSPRMVAALALFLTVFIMQPVWTDIYE